MAVAEVAILLTLVVSVC